MKPWREIAVPHCDVQEGTFQQSEFASAAKRRLADWFPVSERSFWMNEMLEMLDGSQQGT